MVMPDHVHLLISFNPQNEMGKSIATWKSYCARQQNLKWRGHSGGVGRK